MKIPFSKIFFFLFGLAAFVYLVSRFGIDQIGANIARAGWSLLYIVGVWFVIYLLNTAAWRLVLGEAGKKISFFQLFLVTVSGFVINYVTPVIALGGEPYKVRALSGVFGREQSLSAVVLYRMVHLLGHMILLLAGILLALLFLSLPVALNLVFALTAVAICGVIGLTLAGHRRGIFEHLHGWIGRRRIFSRLNPRLDAYRDDVRRMDELLTGVYRRERTKFMTAIALESLSRVCMGVEVYLILYGIGVPVSPVTALFLYVVYSLIINLLFFVPLNLGAREGGLALGLDSIALPALLGVYLGVVMRIREFIWIILGLVFIFFTADRRRPSSAETA
ncbi:MAG TPA: lysylphosphatidylglycerol synthase transmembrane domain-containing protein [Bacteroidota bacterium]|nr:lysylphosphatidylglycerol synthase transmembrane domain-containing protein [Bacteroidota bacterium]